MEMVTRTLNKLIAEHSILTPFEYRHTKNNRPPFGHFGSEYESADINTQGEEI